MTHKATDWFMAGVVLLLFVGLLFAAVGSVLTGYCMGVWLFGG